MTVEYHDQVWIGNSNLTFALLKYVFSVFLTPETQASVWQNYYRQSWKGKLLLAGVCESFVIVAAGAEVLVRETGNLLLWDSVKHHVFGNLASVSLATPS